jgi:hypothetical protein
MLPPDRHMFLYHRVIFLFFVAQIDTFVNVRILQKRML